MSDLTPCNYCNLERIKRAHPGALILLKATNDRYPIDGATIHTGKFLPELIAVTVEGHPVPVAWMDTIPSRCAC